MVSNALKEFKKALKSGSISLGTLGREVEQDLRVENRKMQIPGQSLSQCQL